MTNREKDVFFALIRAGLWGDGNSNLRIDGTTDWNYIYHLAQEQSVQGLVLQGIDVVQGAWLKIHGSPLVPQQLLLQWIGEVQMIEQRNKDMNAFIAGLIEKLRKNDIYALVVKGQGVALCYNRPLWRSCGDVDLFLSDDNYRKAKSVLKTFSTTTEKELKREKTIGMSIKGWTVELHGLLYVGLSSKVNRALNAVQEDTFYGGQVRSWINGKTHVFLLKEENDIFYVFAHILQHFYHGGIGLRQICDWCRLLWTYHDSFDQKLLEQRISEAGIMDEWRAFGALAVEYLGMPIEAMPFYSDSAKWKKKAGQIMEFVMMSGNFGHNRDSRYMNYPYLIRKSFSMGRRMGDLFRHTRIFPLSSLRFFPNIMLNGVRSAMRGE